MATFNLRLKENNNEKIKIIALRENRSKNQQIEFAIEKLIEDFEKLHGKIEI